MMRTNLPNLLAHGAEPNHGLPAGARRGARWPRRWSPSPTPTAVPSWSAWTPEGEVPRVAAGAKTSRRCCRERSGMCRPPVVTQWGQAEMPQGTVVHINVARSPELHSLADGRVLIRHGAENQPLGGEAIRQLAATKSSADFEAEPVAGATRADLDDDIIAEYMEKRAERGRRPISGSVDDHLIEHRRAD